MRAYFGILLCKSIDEKTSFSHSFIFKVNPYCSFFWLLVLQWIFFETIIALLTLFGVFLDTSSDDIGPTRSKKHRPCATTRSVNLKSIVTVHANKCSYHNMFVLLSKNSHMHTATYATLSIFFTKITS